MTAARPLLWTDVELNPAALDLLAPVAEIFVAPRGRLDRLSEARGVIAGSLLPVNAAFFAGAPRLAVVARVGIGYDNVDVPAATAAGVCAVNTPEPPTESTAEFTLALLLAVARQVARADRAMRAGQCGGSGEFMGFDLAGKTLGLVGCGRIGTRVAELAAAFRMTVQAFDPRPEPLPPGIGRVPDLATLLASSDVVSLHVPLLPATRHLINAAALARMRPGAVLLNAARGPIVDEAALLDALRAGRLAGAGLDVWDPEPPAAANPLLALPTVVATPHMAALTREGRVRSHGGAAAQVLQVWRGEKPPALLNPAVWDRRRN